MSKRDYLITDDKTKAVLIDFTGGNNIYMTGTEDENTLQTTWKNRHNYSEVKE